MTLLSESHELARQFESLSRFLHKHEKYLPEELGAIDNFEIEENDGAIFESGDPAGGGASGSAIEDLYADMPPLEEVTDLALTGESTL